MSNSIHKTGEEASAARVPEASVSIPGAWRDFHADPPPDVEGSYEWRLPHKELPISVTFFAWMRKRGAGYRDVISPVFDYWDGYRVTVPPGVFWRHDPDQSNIKDRYVTRHVRPEGIDVLPCPFCGASPKWHAVQKAHNGGTLIPSDPDRLNCWWLECCSWARTPHMADPRELASKRNALIRAALQAPRTDEAVVLFPDQVDQATAWLESLP